MKSCKCLVVLCVIAAVSGGQVRKKFQAKRPRPFFIDDDYCFDNPDVEMAPHQDCTKYWACDADGAFEVDCEPGLIFDSEFLFCGKKKEEKS